MNTKAGLTVRFFIIAFFTGIASLQAQGVISTIAGNGITEFLGDNGPALAGEIASPSSLCTDAAGNFYIADRFNHRIREVNAAGIISTIAGTGTNSYTGDGGPALNATFDIPDGIAIDATGNLYITEFNNHTIRKIDHASHIITTICGNGTPGFSGDGGPAVNAQLYRPATPCLDAAGNIYIPDNGNQRIRKITAATGVITTIAGIGTPGYDADGALAVNAQISYPVAVAVDAAGNVYFTDNGNNRIRKIDGTTGIITTVAGNGSVGFSGDGGAATNATLNNPQGICFDAAGNLYIADYSSNVVRRVSAPDGVITTIAGTGLMGYTGDGGPAVYGTMWKPMGVCTDANSNLFVAEAGNSVVRKITPGVNGINPVNGNDNITVYPNPSSGKILINTNGTASVKIYNTTGQQVYEQAIDNAQTVVDLSAQPPGLYLISVQTMSSITTSKVIISR